MSDELIKLKEWGCDVDGALERMLDDEEFLLDCIKQVASDPSFDTLGTALEKENKEEAFDAAHTLKGIFANTGLSPLFDVVVRIVEPLRAGRIENLLTIYQELLEKQSELLQILQ
ncbi:MAG: Hpt domain-containing protein [Lachnospiraceae bacterium]|nr:Hpt domain-containing protein [Lachnospiraceae bacterium]